MIKVNNLPEYAKNYNWLVCRVVDGELWFWGAFKDEGKAFEIATNMNGVVLLPRLAAA